jgi:hypothetical protein
MTTYGDQQRLRNGVLIHMKKDSNTSSAGRWRGVQETVLTQPTLKFWDENFISLDSVSIAKCYTVSNYTNYMKRWSWINSKYDIEKSGHSQFEGTSLNSPEQAKENHENLRIRSGYSREQIQSVTTTHTFLVFLNLFLDLFNNCGPFSALSSRYRWFIPWG